MNTKVIIDPIANILYASFHIKGLTDRFGNKNIYFNSAPFVSVKNRTGFNFSFILERDGIITKYFMHLDDPYKIDEDAYEWCDVYGHVNANFEKTPTQYWPKIVSLAPMFGIRPWNLFGTIYSAFSNYLKVREQVNIRKFFGKYKRLYKIRRPLNEYFPSPIHSNFRPYVFHMSTLWYDNEWNNNDEGVNKTRANFIITCKSIESIEFEGGLVMEKNRKINPLFEPLIFRTKISIQTYLNNIKKSVLVFNTPAFWDCHGWKLGEYLAMGKAIISTPLSNDLPEPLVHGQNIHIVENNIEEFKKAIIMISNDNEYRKKLEKGAREYWEKYGDPQKSLDLMGI